MEDEVAERKREERWAAIDKFREDSKSKKYFRDKKLSDLENKHDRERRKRDNEYRGEEGLRHGGGEVAIRCSVRGG